MPEINWGLARTPDFAGNAYAARAQGQADRLETGKRNAYALYAQDPDAGAKAIMAIDPVTGIALQDRQTALAATKRKQGYAAQAAGGDITGASTEAMKAGDFDFLESLGKLDDRKKAEVRRQNDIGASVALGLQSLKTPQERAAQIQALAPKLKADGFNDAQIAAIPTDDAGIVSALALSQSVKDILAQRNTDRTFDAGRADATFNQGMETKKFGETVRSNRVGESQRSQQIGLEAQRVGIARQTAAQAGDGVSKATRATEAGLRKEFNGLADVKNYRTVATQAAAVKRLAAAPPSANGDIAMVYAVMKSYDPTSVVRETEFATAQNAAGVPDKIRNQFNAIRNGQRLNPKQRQEMASTVAGFADTYKQRFDTVADEYRSYATDYSGDPDRVVAKSTPTPAAPASTGSVLRFDARGNRIK